MSIQNSFETGFETDHLIVSVGEAPDPNRADMPWVCVIANPDTHITVGVFRTEVRAKLWGSSVAKVLRAYRFVSDEMLDQIVGLGFPDDFDIAHKLN